MPYRVYVFDGLNSLQLDTEDVNIRTVFSVANYKQISTRRDNTTKQVTFKGTKTNNTVFGSLFHLNKISDSTIPNKLNFNYNSLRPVDCFIYEESILIFKGNLRVVEIIPSKSAGILYNTVITGNFIEFKNIIEDKFLTDLDFSHLKHRYIPEVIFNSWDTSIETSSTSGQLQTQPFQKGKGYVYPFIDYGQLFLDTSSGVNSDLTKIKAENFRPAVYLKEYMDCIFKQPGLTGFTYEFKGSPEFLDKIDSLVIPNADETLNTDFSGFNTKLIKNSSNTVTESGLSGIGKFASKLIPLDQLIPPPPNTVSNYLEETTFSEAIFDVKRTITTDAAISVFISSLYSSHQCDAVIQLVERDKSTSTSSNDNWQVIGETAIPIADEQTITNRLVTVLVGERKFVENKQIAVRIGLRYPNFVLLPSRTFSITQAELRMPKDSSTKFKVDVRIGNPTAYDIIEPKAPANIKQIDFIKGIMNLFNLYAYTDKENDKKLIFQTYTDYYGFAEPTFITSTALNWTSRISLKDSIKFASNLTIPKGYLFAYKDDSDFLNAEYKAKYGESYGTYSFSDSLGLAEIQKVEVPFSATICTQYNDTGRFHPALYKFDNSGKVQTKTNIRILFYNGVKSCLEYTIAKDAYTTEWTTEEISTKSTYPQVSTYWYNANGQPESELNFGKPKELYFPYDNKYIQARTHFQEFYSNKIAELTNPNLQIVECYLLLNESDIKNLDLRVPIFIDFNEWGHGYFKVLEVEYLNNRTSAKVQLQKIVLAPER